MQSQNRDTADRTSQQRQEFHHPSCAMGIATHVLKMAGILSPLLILELVKDRDKASRLVRISTVATAGLTEVLWSTRVRRSREEERHR